LQNLAAKVLQIGPSAAQDEWQTRAAADDAAEAAAARAAGESGAERHNANPVGSR
jgi:uncharacterized protein YfiM (DUF2279 family)